MLYEYGKRTREFLGAVLFFLSFFSYIFGAFLIKQLFHSPLLDMAWIIANLALCASLAFYHLELHN